MYQPDDQRPTPTQPRTARAGTRRGRRAGDHGARDRHAAARHGQGALRHGQCHGQPTSPRPNGTPRSRDWSARMFERSHYRQAPVNDPVSSLVLDRYLESLDGMRSYFLASDIAEFEKYRYELDDAITTGKLEPGVRDLQSLPAAQPRAHGVRARSSSTPSPTSSSTRSSSSIASTRRGRRRRRTQRTLAQARQERRAVADAHRQDVGRSARHPEEALRAGRQALRADHGRRRVRELHERVRARVRPALELFLAAQFRGIPHPDEPLVRGHRCVAAVDRRLRHDHGNPAGRLGAAER